MDHRNYLLYSEVEKLKPFKKSNFLDVVELERFYKLKWRVISLTFAVPRFYIEYIGRQTKAQFILGTNEDVKYRKADGKVIGESQYLHLFQMTNESKKLVEEINKQSYDLEEKQRILHKIGNLPRNVDFDLELAKSFMNTVVEENLAKKYR